MKKDTVPLFMTALMLIVFSILMTPLVLAQTAVNQSTTPIAGEDGLKTDDKQNMTTENFPQTIEYNLPYPGILNDHPLYFLKKFRDQLLDIIISDPMKKAEFYLLQSDKFLAMSMMHESKKNTENLLVTADLSADFMQKTVNKINEIKTGGVTPPSMLVDKVLRSKAKHTEIFRKMGESIGDNNIKTNLDTLTLEVEKAVSGLK